ncbi:carbohydrate kinase [Oceanirhabdus seepicola]|uniref:Carbohydrate kinase n=1 Tax=Oceanirhabdus seepicola TaxID=2828781 RepID=A0A9J6NZ57_9CLOT|nr:carbohydrate kinase [Oceanirhabdus seepicola]
MKNKNIICVGELLIDFICSDRKVDLSEGINFIKKAGGAPANVTAAISKLGGEAAFIGKVGADPFGVFLKETLDKEGVNTDMLIMDKEKNTTLAFVSLKDDGERDFVFNRGADEFLQYDEIDLDKIKEAKILHFGSATALLGGDSKETYLKVMDIAYDRDIFFSFDPNYRVDLWKGRLSEFIEVSRKCIKRADFIKVSHEELEIISEKENLEQGVEEFHRLGAGIVCVTLGKDGTFISNGIESGIVKSIKIKSIDSTGAGDAFVGAYLYQLSNISDCKKVREDFDKLVEITTFANKVGAIVCTKLGAISALPTLEEVL